MHISDFDYDLPPERIAQKPLDERDQCRLMVVHRDGRPLEHRRFPELKEFLKPGDLLVVNDTRVMPARLLGLREGFTGQIEILLVRPHKRKSLLWEALARPARKLDVGTVVTFDDGGVRARIVAAADEGRRLVEFEAGVDVPALMRSQGHIPLPPYISRDDEPSDREWYQTVFARSEGAIAAPTAGLHFTEERLAELEAIGVRRTSVTLHVGPGTFRPIMSEDPRQHVIEPEWYEVPEAAVQAFRDCRSAGGRVVACGTTVVRTLESSAREAHQGVQLEAGAGWADLFIYDPYPFKTVDVLLTNFHLPRSTLLMLVSAFGGLEAIRRAYRAAIREGYRFYSYGDAMLID